MKKYIGPILLALVILIFLVADIYYDVFGMRKFINSCHLGSRCVDPVAIIFIPVILYLYDKITRGGLGIVKSYNQDFSKISSTVRLWFVLVVLVSICLLTYFNFYYVPANQLSKEKLQQIHSIISHSK